MEICRSFPHDNRLGNCELMITDVNRVLRRACFVNQYHKVNNFLRATANVTSKLFVLPTAHEPLETVKSIRGCGQKLC